VSLAKKRKNYISGIRKWDYYSLRNNPDEALSYYLQVAEKIPNDQVVRKKIAHVYALQKNWKSSYENYIQVPISELSEIEKNEMLQALFFDEWQIDRIGEVSKIALSSGTTDYYRIVDTCYSGIHNCIVAIEAYSGSYDTIISLQSIIKESPFVSPDFQYRNLSVAATLYEQGMYGASRRIAQEILGTRPDYMEASKILGFSHYELGNYQDAKNILLPYIEKNPNDLESVVRIGEIYAHLGDLVSSNLSLNSAILNGYSPKTDLERRLAYNYSLLDDTPALLRVMNYLLQEEDVKEDDYAVGISVALGEWENPRARNWSEEALKKFPKSIMLTPLYIQSLRMTGDRDLAQMLVDTADTTLAENPNFLLQKAILLFEAANYDLADEVFHDLVELEEWPSVVEEAQAYIVSIDTIRTASWALEE